MLKKLNVTASQAKEKVNDLGLVRSFKIWALFIEHEENVLIKKKNSIITYKNRLIQDEWENEGKQPKTEIPTLLSEQLAGKFPGKRQDEFPRMCPRIFE